MTFDNSFLKAKLMRDAGLGFFLCLAVFFAAFSFLMLQPAVAADAPPGYDAYDYQTIRDFLELSVDGVKNGEKINLEYDPDDPTTWTGVTWDGVSSRRVKEIAWTEKGLAGIMNLSGCTALQKLTCDGNQLTGLVVNGCEALKGINCKNNYLTQLEFSDCPVLEILDCGFNPFTALTISGSQWREINLNNCEALQKLICTGNERLTKLDLTGCTSLEELNCDNNYLQDLRLRDCIALKRLSCNNNSLQYLSAPDSAALEEVYCSDNRLTSLDFSGHAALRKIICSHNQLETLNVNNCGVLEYIDCRNNKLQHFQTSETTGIGLIITRCYALKELYCGNNTFYGIQISGFWLNVLDLSGCPNLNHLTCKKNDLVSLDVSNCPKLEEFNCNENRLTSLNVSGCTVLPEIYCQNNKLSTLYIENCPALKTIYCSNNELTRLVASESFVGCGSLKKIYCSNNILTEIDLSGSSITEIDCSYNKLTEIDLSGCTSITGINCQHNQLTRLDVSGCINLAGIYCSYNKLTELDISGCPNLNSLDCSNNRFTFSTLPLFKPLLLTGKYIYRNQADVHIGDADGDIVINEEVDLSAEVLVNGEPTTFTWYITTGTGYWLRPATPTTEAGGKFTFDESFAGEFLVCVMTNSSFEELELETIPFFVQPAKAKITREPNDLMVAGGKPAVFTVKAEVEGRGAGNLTYQWQVSADEGVNWSDIPEATGESYTIPAVTQEEDGNWYRCKVTNTKKGASLDTYSNTVTLIVAVEPVIITHPEDVTVGHGGKATFSVEAEADGELRYQWQLSRDQGFTWEDIPWGREDTFTTSSVYFADNGTWYRCAVTNTKKGENVFKDVTSDPVYSNHAVLSVVANPEFITHPEDIMVSPGEPATFSVVAKAPDAEEGGTLSYQWQLSEDEGTTWKNIEGATEPSYTIPETTFEDNGKKFRCVVKNTKNETDSREFPSLSATLSVRLHEIVFIRPSAANDASNPLNINTGSLMIARIDGDIAKVLYVLIQIDDRQEQSISPASTIYYLLPTNLNAGEHTITIRLYNNAGQEIIEAVTFHWDNYRRGFGFGRFDFGEADTHAEE